MTAKVSEMHDSLWNQILSALGERLPATTLESWLRPCRLTTLDGDHLHIAAPNTYTRDWVLQNHASALTAAARAVIGGNPQLTLDVDPDIARLPPSPPCSPPATPSTPSS